MTVLTKTLLALPYYKHGSKNYIRIQNAIQRHKKKYGIKSEYINKTIICLQKGEKNCRVCKKTLKIFEFRWQKTKNIFRDSCRKCESLHNKQYKKIQPQNPEWRKTQRVNLLKKISNDIKCVRCGCDDWRFLEINHINGGGNKEAKIYRKTTRSINEIIRKGWRTTVDLNLLCRPCNSIDHLERKYNKKIKMRVLWNE